LRSLLIENNEPKSFGLSKLNVQIITKLLDALGGEFVILNENTDKQDIGFKFPLSFVQIPEKPLNKSPEKNPPVQEEIQMQKQIPDEEPQLLHIQDEIEIVEEDHALELNHDRQKAEVVEKEEIAVIEELKHEPEKLVFKSQKQEVVQEEKPQQQTQSKNNNGLSSLRCLYIEDQVDSQILFKVQMKDLKNIQFATSFEEALPLLEAHEFDFIIMDINLQGEYNGLDALKVIHQIPDLKKIPVIAVTAYVLPGDKEKFLHLFNCNNGYYGHKFIVKHNV